MFYTSILIAGLYIPITSAVIGAVYLLIRVGYANAYSKGPTFRKPFAPFIILS
jgi:hypothetical protein